MKQFVKTSEIKSIVFIFRGFSMWTRNMGGRYVSSEWVDGFIKTL